MTRVTTGTSLLLRNATLDGGRSIDLLVKEGRIEAMESVGHIVCEGTEEIDVTGDLVLPGLVDGHCHLDKTMLGDVWVDNDSGPALKSRIEHERRIESLATRPVFERASALVELAVSKGTTRMRSHVDVDPLFGAERVAAVAKVREHYRYAVDIQIVAFPQLGVISRPGIVGALEAALEAGADVIGGIDPAGIDGSVEGQLRIIFELAAKHNRGIDFHLHDQGTLGLYQLEQIAARTIAGGLQGRVAVSHAHALGSAPEEAAARVAETLARAGIAIVTYGPGAVPLPPIHLLRAAGVTVFAGNDNIRDPWSPFGTADMLERAMLIAYRSGYRSDKDLRLAFELASSAAAAATGADDYGLRVGCWADFFCAPALSVPHAVASRPSRSIVVKRGRVVARSGTFLR